MLGNLQDSAIYAARSYAGEGLVQVKLAESQRGYVRNLVEANGGTVKGVSPMGKAFNIYMQRQE